MPPDLFARIRKVRVLLGAAHLDLALPELHDLAREVSDEEGSRAMGLLARYNRVSRDRTDNLISSADHSVTLSQIDKAAASFLHDLERRVPEFVDIPGPTRSVAEAIFGQSHLRSVGWLRRGLSLARSVVRVRIPGGSGTGFLVAGGLLLTNHHVLTSKEVAGSAELDFDFEADAAGLETSGPRARLDRETWRADPASDCAVARVVPIDGVPLDEREPLPLVAVTPRAGEQVSIIQHPEGRPKQIAVTANEVVDVSGTTLRYTTHTLHGSSGAPVFDERWRVVALHKAGGNVVTSRHGESFYANAGTLMSEVGRVLGLAVAPG